MTLATNIICTGETRDRPPCPSAHLNQILGLVAFRIWSTHRRVKGYSATTLWPVMIIVIEVRNFEGHDC